MPDSPEYNELERSGYNSIDSSRRWLNGTRDHTKNEDTLKSLRIILLFILFFLTLYLLITTILGYMNPDTISDKNISSDPQGFGEKKRLYFWISGVIALLIVALTSFAVIKESPTLSMLCSIFMLLAVAQSLSNVFHNLPISYNIFELFFVSPAAIMGLVGCLLAIYTSLIWSSEFETPPYVIEEYRGYLNRIREMSEKQRRPKSDQQQETLTPGKSGSMATITTSVSAGDIHTAGTSSAHDRQVMIHTPCNSVDDLTSSSYHSSKSSD